MSAHIIEIGGGQVQITISGTMKAHGDQQRFQRVEACTGEAFQRRGQAFLAGLTAFGAGALFKAANAAF